MREERKGDIRVTNGDRLRAMDNRELAVFLYGMEREIYRILGEKIGYPGAFSFGPNPPELLEWLESPAGEIPE